MNRCDLGNVIPCAVPLAFGVLMVVAGNGFTLANLGCLAVFAGYFVLGCYLDTMQADG